MSTMSAAIFENKRKWLLLKMAFIICKSILICLFVKVFHIQFIIKNCCAWKNISHLVNCTNLKMWHKIYTKLNVEYIQYIMMKIFTKGKNNCSQKQRTQWKNQQNITNLRVDVIEIYIEMNFESIIWHLYWDFFLNLN